MGLRFDAAKHPRDRNGKFKSKGGGSRSKGGPSSYSASGRRHIVVGSNSYLGAHQKRKEAAIDRKVNKPINNSRGARIARRVGSLASDPNNIDLAFKVGGAILLGAPLLAQNRVSSRGRAQAANLFGIAATAAAPNYAKRSRRGVYKVSSF